ncbi:hypothetical protein Sste5346_005121 [Sporothrix stenoceras]|uniref:Uncharacterized protein n=1 Tax=Sporothrix stenoceras TaxID=5173 RepID=A0ABR3Z4U5_9PEZI
MLAPAAAAATIVAASPAADAQPVAMAEAPPSPDRNAWTTNQIAIMAVSVVSAGVAAVSAGVQVSGRALVASREPAAAAAALQSYMELVERCRVPVTQDIIDRFKKDLDTSKFEKELMKDTVPSTVNGGEADKLKQEMVSHYNGLETEIQRLEDIIALVQAQSGGTAN